MISSSAKANPSICEDLDENGGPPCHAIMEPTGFPAALASSEQSGDSVGADVGDAVGAEVGDPVGTEVGTVGAEVGDPLLPALKLTPSALQHCRR